MMREVFKRPPMFDEINAAFSVAGKPVIFCFGDTIYNPQRMRLTRALHAHEAVHGRRQGDDIEGWWRKYIADPAFRLTEEIPAHRAEYATLMEGCANRAGRRRHLAQISKRLASPLYGRMINIRQARSIILGAA